MSAPSYDHLFAKWYHSIVNIALVMEKHMFNSFCKYSM